MNHGESKGCACGPFFWFQRFGLHLLGVKNYYACHRRDGLFGRPEVEKSLFTLPIFAE